MTGVRDKPRPGRPAEAVTPTIVANIRNFINKDRRVTLQEIAITYHCNIGKAWNFTRKKKV